jgi:hypothetical protein
MRQPNSDQGRLIVVVSTSHTDTHTLGTTRLKEWSAGSIHSKRRHSQQTNIHGLNGIRTRDSSIKAAPELRLRTHGHRKRPPPTHFHWALSSNEGLPRSISTENMELDNPSQAVSSEMYSIVTTNVRERNVIFWNMLCFFVKNNLNRRYE